MASPSFGLALMSVRRAEPGCWLGNSTRADGTPGKEGPGKTGVKWEGGNRLERRGVPPWPVTPAGAEPNKPDKATFTLPEAGGVQPAG